MEMASWDPTRKDSCWLCAGMPVMGSRRVFSCAMLHAGEILRSDDEFADAIIRGTSAALCRDMLVSERLRWWPRRDFVGASANGADAEQNKVAFVTLVWCRLIRWRLQK